MLSNQSTGVKDVDQSELVKAVSEFLKKNGKLKVPEWVDIVKTGVHKELAPYEADWYYTRCASLARIIYFRSPVGVGSVSRVYGGRYRRGTRPSHFRKGSKSVARKALQSLQDIGWIELSPDGGRKLTRTGERDLTLIANTVKTKASLISEAAL